MYDYHNNYYPDYLMHYGVKGMKWGHRKSQAVIDAKAAYKSAKKDYSKAYDKAYGYSSRHMISQYVGKKQKAESDRRWDDAINKAEASRKAKENYKQVKKADKEAAKAAKNTPEAIAKRKKALKVGAAVAGTALAAYGAYKVTKAIKDENFKIAEKRGLEAMDAYIKDNHRTTTGVLGGNVRGVRPSVASNTATGRFESKVFNNTQEAEGYVNKILENNVRVAQEANKIREGYTDRAKRDSLKDAAKNVYNYNRERKRR